MKTLIISVDYPLPEDKGNRMRTMHFARFFKERGDVDLMCYKSHAPVNPIIHSPFNKEFYLELNTRNSENKVNLFRSIYEKCIELKPWIVNNFSANSVNYVHEIIVAEDYDVILCRYSVNAYPLLSLPVKYKKRVILDIDDIMTWELYDVKYGVKKGLNKLKAAIDKAVFLKYQQKCLDLGKVLFCSEIDKLKMSTKYNADNLFVVPNILPKQEITDAYNRDGFDSKYILFVGTLSYEPNERGILWFITEVFQKLPQNYNDLCLLVVGKDPGDKLKQVCSQNLKIELVQNPPDVMPYYEKCHALIVPVFVGGGTRIKILEAGNFFRPVMSTLLGAYGLGLEDYNNILYFSDKETFIDKLKWLENNDSYHQLVDNLNKTVEKNYNIKTFIKCMELVIK
jgi:polysaccharide biosynthesis protein PslH